jgi:predicted DNA-binding protein with PD1-like motif
MLSTESRRGRRILARLDRGSDLFDGLRALCQKHDIRCAELRGIGELELAELAAFDQGSGRWKPARVVSGGGLELLHLHGNISEERGAISIQIQVTLMRDRDAGMEVIGGHLQRAVVYSVELVVETFDDVLMRRQLDAATGLARWHEALSEQDSTWSARPGASPTAPPPAPPNATPGAFSPGYAPPISAPRAPALSPRPGTSPGVTPSARPNASPAAPPRPSPAPVASAHPSSSPAPSVARPGTSPGVPLGARPAAAPGQPIPTATPTPTWADVAAASQSAPPARPASEPTDSHDEDVSLNAGDVIMHPRFQRCVVHRVEGNGEFVQVMLRNGRVVRLSLEVLRLTPQGIENGQRIFTATVL